MTWGSANSTWPSRPPTTRRPMPSTRRWAASASRIPPWAFTSSPTRTGIGLRSSRDSGKPPAQKSRWFFRSAQRHACDQKHQSQQKEIQNQLPLVLLGIDFWSGLIEWMKDKLLSKHYIREDELECISLTDSVDEAVNIIKG